jgi:hypothetical protein
MALPHRVLDCPNSVSLSLLPTGFKLNRRRKWPFLPSTHLPMQGLDLKR